MKLLMKIASFFRRVFGKKNVEPEAYDDTRAMKRLVDDQVASINYHQIAYNGKAKTKS